VLAVIEHEQHLLVFEEGDQIGARLLRSGLEPEHGSERDRQLEGLANRCQIDEPHPVLVVRRQPLGHGEGGGGLAYAAWSRRWSRNAGAAVAP
jgi:hypothetical protein